ncbi:MAG: ATP-binding cassette domain-containing protein [Candidatus Hydrogenedentes bacterium]|nr:ATP-binding cassette domain-containing protein [Candidatus Hydrogenedentota bacterium]
MIEVQGLTKYFGSIAALQDATFSIEAGEIVGFLGPNGAGKSTAMRILTGFFPASRGEARIDGYEVHENPLEVKRRVGYLPENVPLYDEMTVKGFLTYVARMKGVARTQQAEELDRVMEKCGLRDMGKRTLHQLSKGYRQRVGIAQALTGSPPVLILDEPTVGLDPGQIVDIRSMIKELGGDHTVLLSTHILPEVSMVCDRVIIISRGHIVAQDTMEQLTAAGGKTLEQAFMDAVASDRSSGTEETQ